MDAEVTVEQISGPTVGDGFGLTLRAVGSDNRYDVYINSDSEWAAVRCNGVQNENSASCSNLVGFTPNAAINGGLNVPNTIKASARGTHFDVFVNGVSVGSFDDTNYTSGKIGVIVNQDIECVFTNLTITRFG